MYQARLLSNFLYTNERQEIKKMIFEGNFCQLERIFISNKLSVVAVIKSTDFLRKNGSYLCDRSLKLISRSRFI